MEMIDRPMSETASKILALIWTADGFIGYSTSEVSENRIIINAKGKLKLAKQIGVSVKRIANCITELIYLGALARLDRNVYSMSNGFVIDTKDEVIIPTTYKYRKS